MNDRRGLLGGLAGMVSLVLLPRTARSQEVKYVYDVHGRLVAVDRTGNPRRYSYDAADNRTERAPGAAPSPAGPRTLEVTLSTTAWHGTVSAGEEPVRVLVTGGVGPFTYQWRRVSGSNRVWPLNSTAAATGFTGNPTQFQGFTGMFVCKVTDALGTQLDSNSVSATVGPDQ